MDIDLNDLNAFLTVARAKGFRDGARASGNSASGLSESVRRLETQLGVRLLNRTTRSVVPTEAKESHLTARTAGPAAPDSGI
jgi:DNA-binding transcriptional LysR family regulator